MRNLLLFSPFSILQNEQTNYEAASRLGADSVMDIIDINFNEVADLDVALGASFTSKTIKTSQISKMRQFVDVSNRNIYKTKCDMTDPVGPGCVSSVEDVKVIVTIHVEPLELEEELLDDGLCLEGDDAVLVPLVPAVQHHAVHRAGEVGQEAALPALAARLADRV